MCNETVNLEIDGKPVSIDKCISPYVKALNDAGLETDGCCCGHGRAGGYIVMKNGAFIAVSLKDMRTPSPYVMSILKRYKK